MNSLILLPNNFLHQQIRGFYHTDYFGYRKPNNPDFLNFLKNDDGCCPAELLEFAVNQLIKILIDDLPQILKQLGYSSLTVCTVPRARAENTYRPNQLLFKSTVQNVIKKLKGFEDGTNYIVRHTTTRTTHLRKLQVGFINDGPEPYPGITLNTCHISENIVGKNILLIDDIYTHTVNVDEDAIQALLTKRAQKVFFYAVGRTVSPVERQRIINSARL
ncbi:MAG: amidophosphoribosyltransferase [Bacteroidia bacterium]|nr:amidophosphoribosyltransferase [Bacteroidia bacterium]MDW8157836.1 amidophosphoribosyltransferase [Bacteroidia bacterium]